MGGEGQAPGESANRRERSTHTAHAVRAPGRDAAAIESASRASTACLYGWPWRPTIPEGAARVAATRFQRRLRRHLVHARHARCA